MLPSSSSCSRQTQWQQHFDQIRRFFLFFAVHCREFLIRLSDVIKSKEARRRNESLPLLFFSSFCYNHVLSFTDFIPPCPKRKKKKKKSRRAGGNDLPSTYVRKSHITTSCLLVLLKMWICTQWSWPPILLQRAVLLYVAFYSLESVYSSRERENE